MGLYDESSSSEGSVLIDDEGEIMPEAKTETKTKKKSKKKSKTKERRLDTIHEENSDEE